VAIKVRRATLDDVGRLASIQIEAWRSAYTGLITPARLSSMHLGEYSERWRRLLSADLAPDAITFVATVDGVLASYCSGGSYRPQADALPEATSRWGELFALYTDPALTRRGAGTAVHEALIRDLARQGHTTAALWVLAANTSSRQWYADRGWRADGATSEWVSHGVAHPEIRMLRSLSGDSS
jgi:GNAT superfamily N-acetyltransferase